MSMPYSVIYCDSCDYRCASHVLWGIFRYRFDDGHESYMERLLGWCTDCESVCPVEDLPHSAVLDRQLAEVREQLGRLASNVVWGWAASVFSRKRKSEIHELREREADLTHVQQMLASRVAPPRCLRCASTSTAPLPLRVPGSKQYDYALGTPHPGCGGVLRVRDSGGTRLAIARRARIYSPEGELINAV